MIRIIAVGKKTDKDLINAIQKYEKRLRPPFNIQWELLPYSIHQDEAARNEESQQIIAKLKPSDKVLLLDERGRQMTSPEFSAELTKGGNVTIIIGGAYGVSDELRQRANQTISLSKMVFPHQLVRLILAEQIYRAQAIYQGLPYHHE